MQLKEIRKGLGISQSQVARDLNITQATYNRYENGQRQIPNSILLSMADYFNVSSDEILGRPGQKEHQESEEIKYPKTTEAQIISRCVDKMSVVDRERALNLLKAVYKDYFEKIETEEKMA